jgi:hypothetical protein
MVMFENFNNLNLNQNFAYLMFQVHQKKSGLPTFIAIKGEL